ncbi:MAG: extracellular solute-binding protein [Microbacterium sp.]|uniref:extracellular solute-binding protein n=1 Tax=Microbacterium sp. TaxID=51671 RepID=UPI0039E2E8E7
MKYRITMRRSRLAAVAVTTAAVIALAGCSSTTTSSSDASSAIPDKPDSLTINVFSGAFEDNMEKYVVEPFEADTGITVNMVTTAPPLATLEAEGDSPEIDIYVAGDPQRLLAEQAGVLQPYDPDVVTNAADLFDVAKKSDSAVVMNYASQGLVYDTTKITTAPTSWFDLFDLDLPNEVVVRSPDAQNTVSWLSLMAYTLNGAWPTQLSDYDEVLDEVKTELKPNLYSAASSSGDLATAMTSGAAALGVWQDSQVIAANADGSTLAYAAPEEGSIPVATMIALTNTPNKYWAEVLMNYMLDPVAQAGWASNGGYGPSNSTAVVSDELAAQITYGPDEVNALVQIPWEQIVPLETDLIAKFNEAIG